MHLRSPLSGFVLALSGALLAAAAGTDTRVEFASRVVEGAALRGVKDSGVCETTPGVGQMSGYLDVGKNMSMVSLFCSLGRRCAGRGLTCAGCVQWFWFFEARHEPETAPFTLWYVPVCVGWRVFAVWLRFVLG